MTEGPDVMLTMNKVMHNALRRDLDRMRRVVDETSPVPKERRDAIATHMAFTLARLHHHHTGEDTGLWPLLEQKDPSSRVLFTTLAEQHDALQSTINDLLVALTAYAAAPGDDDATRAPVRATLDAYAETLLPHLEFEEHEAPTHVQHLSVQECATLEKKYFREKLPPGQLGYLGYWLMDDATDEERRTVASRVPAPVFWILKRTSGPAYQKKTSYFWGPSR